MTTLQTLQSKVGIDLSDVTPGIAEANKQIGQGITQATETAQAGLNGLAGSFDVLSRQEQQVEQQTIRTAQAQARALAAEGDRAGAIRVLTQAQSEARGISEQTNYQLDAQIASLEKGEAAATDYSAAFSQGLGSIVGPMALVTAGIGAAIGVVDSFKEAFTFDAQLGANTKAIEVQLQGVRDSGQAFSEAQHYANEYKLTQQETNEAMIASIPVIRNSQASMEEILGTFDRLKIRSPEKSFQDAARALGELQAGQVQSIEHIFNVPADDANRMKKEIQEGGDAVEVLSKYLTDSGIGMDALKSKTEGAMGALKDYEKAQEALTIQEGEFAKGPGIALLGAASSSLGDITKTLQGDFRGLNDILKDTGVTGVNPLIDGIQRYNTTVIGAGKSTLEWLGIIKQLTPEQQRMEESGARADARMGDLSGSMYGAGRAAQQLSDADLAKLQKTLDDTANKASDAYAKLTQAQTDYDTKSQSDATAQQTKLADMATKFGADLAKIDQTATNDRAKALDDWRDRTTKITDDGHRALLTLEDAYNTDLASKRAAANVRYQQIDTDLARKIADDRLTSAGRIAEIEAQAATDSLTQTQATADRRAAVELAISTATQDASQKLATFEQSTLDARASAYDAYEQRVTQASAAAARQQQDQARTDARAQEDAATRAADQAQDRQLSAESAAQAHADRLAQIAAQASGSSTTGRTTTLTGGRFVTQSETSSGNDVSAQIAAENAKYQAQLEATARSQALSDSRAARDTQTQAERQAEDRALQQQDLVAQASAQDAAYALQLAKAQEAAEKQRQTLIQAGNDKLAAIQDASAKAEAAAAKSDAAADARTQAQIAKERQAQVTRESDASRSADRAHADLIAATNRDLADRQAGYETARQNAIAATARQQQDENSAYAKRLVAIEQQRAQARASATQAYNQQLSQEITAYNTQEAARLTAYRTQVTNLKTALGEQETAYVKAQQAIGQITATEAQKREAIIQASYGRQADAQRAAFNAAFGDLTGPAALGARQESLANTKDQGLIGGGGGNVTFTGQINLPGVQNAQQFLNELRGIVANDVRSNGGDANKYWGGR